MSKAALILVRHAEPAVDPATSPSTWRLTEASRSAAAALAEQLAGFAPVAAVSSPEPKALETAQIIARRFGLPVAIDTGLVELHRPGLPFGTRAEFEARMASFFRAPNEPFFGGESANEARARFVAALARFPQRPLLVGTHGTMLSVYVAEVAGLDAFDLWRGLAMPEAFVLSADGALIARFT